MLLRSILAAACGFALVGAALGEAPITPRASYPNYGSGSCACAAAEDVLSANGYPQEAERWRSRQSGILTIDPQTPYPSMVDLAERRGLRYAYTVDGDEAFLAWCSRSRLAAVIYWPPYAGYSPVKGRRVPRPNNEAIHAIAFFGFDTRSGDAWVLDNNEPNKLRLIPRADFLAAWRLVGGQAWTVLPPPALQ